jgi:hypothetical protein
MKLAKYWTRSEGEATDRKGRVIRAVARGWSNGSMEGARAVARDIAQRLAQGNFPTRGPQYLYGDRPLPEPVLREFQGTGEGPRAIVTRNVYGAEVLNTRNLMFVDIDKSHQPPAPASSTLKMGLRALFGKSASAPPVETDEPAMTKIRGVGERNNLAGRVYKTAGGYRVLITSAGFTPGDSWSEDLLQQFASDPLYIRLCRMQESFRARLTPKPWRCGLHNPPVKFPFETPQDQSRFDVWERTYTAAGKRFRTCQYIASFGGGSVAPGFEELIQFHDQETKAVSVLPLA